MYEYGAQKYDTLPDGRIIFTEASDSSVRVLDPSTGRVDLITQSSILRYAAFNANPMSPWVVAIEEDHTKPGAYDVKNYLVAINTDTKEIKRIISGSDFYYIPEFSFDGTRLAWLEWNHPDMMFKHAQLHHGEWNPDGSVTNITFVTGKNEESVTEPRWGYDGSLFFCREFNDYRQLFRIVPGSDKPEQVALKGLEDAEIGEVSLMEGSRTVVPLTTTRLLASVLRKGEHSIVSIDLDNNSWRQVVDTESICSAGGRALIRESDTTGIVAGAGRKSLKSVFRVDIANPERNQLLRRSSSTEYPAKAISPPEGITINSKGSPSRQIHGWFHQPHNADYTGPEGELPPLVIWAHGGPTGCNPNSLSPKTQYLTSRGYAYLIVNYAGSTGYGGKYRDSLLGNWGILDADDIAEFANHLIETKRVKAGAVGITGISAGGYNTLQCLTRHPDTFASGVCVSGVSELKTFDLTTHKLESDYLSHLVFRKGNNDEEQEKIYHDRSPIYHADKIKAPLLLIHAEDDTVVPIEQAKSIEKVLREKKQTVKLIEVPDEGHSVGKPVNTKMWIEQEEKWWNETLLN